MKSGPGASISNPGSLSGIPDAETARTRSGRSSHVAQIQRDAASRLAQGLEHALLVQLNGLVAGLDLDASDQRTIVQDPAQASVQLLRIALQVADAQDEIDAVFRGRFREHSQAFDIHVGQGDHQAEAV